MMSAKSTTKKILDAEKDMVRNVAGRATETGEEIISAGRSHRLMTVLWLGAAFIAVALIRRRYSD